MAPSVGDNRKELRLAVAGTGAMARYHLARFGTVGAVVPVACYDRSRERSRGLAREYSLRAYHDTDSFLDDRAIDAVSVAVADLQHYELCAAAIRRGIPVFMEKPFTVDVPQAEELVNLQARHGVPVLVNFSKLNYPAIYALVVAAARGRLGTIREIELRYQQRWMTGTVWGEWWRNPRWLWRISSSHGGGGALRDLGSHLLFLALRLGGAVKEVQIQTSADADRSAAGASGYSCDMNDTFTMALNHSEGAVSHVHGSYADPHWTNHVYLRVTGTEGSAEVSAERDKNVLVLSRNGTVRTLRFAKVYSTYDAFVAAVLSGVSWETFQPSAAEGLAVQKVIAGAVKT